MRESNIGDTPVREIRTFAAKYPFDLGELLTPFKQEGYVGTQYTDRVGIKHRMLAMPDLYRQYRDRYNLSTLWPGEIILLPLGAIATETNGIDTSGTPQKSNSRSFSLTMLDSQKRITIDLTRQNLIAYEASVPVLQTPISTGRPGYETAAGNFRVTWKVDSMDYWSPFSEVDYFQPQVPFNLMIYLLTYIHGTYWHDEFGTRQRYGRSYGCVNIDLYEAGWLYNWAPYNTPVRITY